MSEGQQVTPISPGMTSTGLGGSESPSSTYSGTNKRSAVELNESKRIKLNTPDVTLSPGLEQSSPVPPPIRELTNIPTGLFEIFNNPILVLDLSEMTPDTNVGSLAPELVLKEVKTSAVLPNTECGVNVPVSTVPEITQETEKPEKPDTPTKRQLERMEKQKQRELERAERERKKEEEKRLKREEKERKDRERQLKKEMLEKEKERKREEERIRKEERKKKLEDEKKRKEEERKAKEEEKRLKEEEKRMKEQQKERSQMKILSFFSVKPVTKTAARTSPTKKEKTDAPQVSTYNQQFLPFFVKQNVSMAPSGALPLAELSISVAAFDLGLETGKKTNICDLVPGLSLAPLKAWTTSEQIVEAMNSASTTEKILHQLVENLPPIKYLQFYENAKPPYIGTWCSETHMKTDISASNPLDTQLTGFDYDYDSDLDWDEDDEGEDIDDLDEEDDDEEANEEDDMDDFVDNDATKRRVPIATLQAVSRWNTGSTEDINHFDDIRYERLDYDITFPIDPLRDYWKSEPKVDEGPTKDAKPQVLTSKRSITDEKVVAALIKFVEKNSDFSIGTLSELAKKEFKTYTKSMLKHTIQEVASYNKKKSVWEIKTT